MAAGMTTDRWKAKLDDYVLSAKRLLESMRAGWNGEPIPIDPDGELLDGSHRVACAIALELPEVPVVSRWNYVWAPRWDIEWFWRNGMPDAELQRTIDDWDKMRGNVSC